jgi:RNA polymerase sigma factor (sigma-70 family)
VPERRALAVALMAVTGDFATAEDLVQDAVVTALRRWPTEGIPDRPDAWLFTVARNRGLDVLRREANYRTKLAQLQWPVQPEPDERLRLIFTCCHPALSRPAQIALTLRVVCGLTTAQIARAFLTAETTVAQRTRAKRKIADAGIPYRIPDPDELNARLGEVLAVIYLLLDEGYLSTAEQAQSRDLVDDAHWRPAAACRAFWGPRSGTASWSCSRPVPSIWCVAIADRVCASVRRSCRACGRLSGCGCRRGWRHPLSSNAGFA